MRFLRVYCVLKMTNWSAMNNQEAKTKKTEQIMIFAQIMERRYISRQISAIHKCQLLLALLVFSIFFLSGLDGLLHLRESPGCRKFSDIQAWGNLIDGLLQILADFTNPISINQTLFLALSTAVQMLFSVPFLLSGI